MSDKFRFDLVSPEKKLLSEDVTMVIVPGEEGEIGVLSGHAPLVASAKIGVIRVFKDDQNSLTDRIFVTGGFADISNDGVSFLAEEAVNVNDIDVTQLDQDINNLSHDLKLVDGDADRNRIEKKLLIAEAKKAALAEAA